MKGKFKININGKYISLYFTVFLVLFASNMVASSVLGTVGRNLFWIYGFVLLIWKNRNYIFRDVLFLCGFIIFRLVLLLLQFDFSTSFLGEMIGIALTLNTLFQIARLFSAQQFSIAYIDIMSIICVVSLICFYILIKSDASFIYSITDVQEGYRHTWFYTWGWDDFLFDRNAGPWWEPGAFQCFITLGMLIIMGGNVSNCKHLRIKFIILAYTWITTQSTTGYILMAFVYILMFKKIVELVYNKKFSDVSSVKKILVVSVMSIAIIVFYKTIGLSNISNKIYEQTASFDLRIAEIINTFSISLINPLIGVGERFLDYYAKYDINNNSAAVLTIPMMHGWIYFIAYLVALLLGIRRFFLDKKNIYVFGGFLCLIMLGLTEGIVFLPTFMIFFANFQKTSEAFIIE